MNLDHNLHVAEIFRYPRPAQPDERLLDGMRNFYAATAAPSTQARVQLESGINPVAVVGGQSERRRPAVLIRSSPWKAGTSQTPWHDWFDLETMRGTYFGDHKPETVGPLGVTAGNKVLAEVRALHSSSSRADRAAAPPLVLFRAVPWTHPDGKVRQKGAVEFLGIALIADLDVVSSIDSTGGLAYPNLRAQLRLLPLSTESETLDWTWINARRAPLPLSECLVSAPSSWRDWVNQATDP